MQNPLCDVCSCLVSNPVETKDGKRVCPSCFNKNFEGGVMKVEPKAVVFKSAVPAKPAFNDKVAALIPDVSIPAPFDPSTSPGMTDLMADAENYFEKNPDAGPSIDKAVSELVRDNDSEIKVASPKIVIDETPETEAEAFEKEFEKSDETPVEVPKASSSKKSSRRRR